MEKMLLKFEKLDTNSAYFLDWESTDSHLLINKNLPAQEIALMADFFSKQKEQSHIFLATSGSSSLNNTYKLIALSKKAILNSSQSVNKEFQITQNDVLLNILPTFHVGGLSLFSRAFCAQAKVVNKWIESFKWNAKQFVEICQDSNATVTSLVPTQIYDLVSAKLESPKKLRCVFVGGGHLSKKLFFEAQELGWKLYPSYGMTECCSQVATLSYNGNVPDDNEFFSVKILPHLSVSLNSEFRIIISGSSLLSYEVRFENNAYAVSDPKINGVLCTNDIGSLKENNLQVLGRVDDHVKIKGELVNLLNMNQKFLVFASTAGLKQDCAIVSLPDARSGNKLIACFAENSADLAVDKIDYSSILNQFNQTVLSHERVRKHLLIKAIPRTDLGKLRTNALRKIAEKLITRLENFIL